MFSFFKNDYVKFEDQFLPPKNMRFGGEYFKSNKDFIISGKKEVNRLVSNFGFSQSSELLEIGCGPGRLAIGILNSLGKIENYHGIDIHKISILWCKKYIEDKHPSFHFEFLNLRNKRYSPDGDNDMQNLKLPINTSFDIIYLYSVFSHLLEKDISTYLKEFKRLLKPQGNIFLTAFIKEGVPPVSVNPDNYIRNWEGPLHCVRYNKAYLFSLFENYGFHVSKIEYEKETDCQSGIYLSRKSN